MQFYDEHTLYVTSGVATQEQLHTALLKAIKQGETNYYNEILVNSLYDIYISDDDEDELDYFFETLDEMSTIDENKLFKNKIIELGEKPPKKEIFPTDVDVNLIMRRDGSYFGFGYIRVSNEKVHSMLLGKNPDGEERINEYEDPNWIPPLPKSIHEDTDMDGWTWFEMDQDVRKYMHPTITEELKSLTTIPGYEYNKIQFQHLQDLAVKEGNDPSSVPKIGHFEISQAYVKRVDSGKMPNVLCARKVPDWFREMEFKNRFKRYASDPKKRVLTKDKKMDSYPMINLIKKNNANIAFITFDPAGKDASFSLLMTRKVTINTKNNKSCSFIFDHAYENSNKGDRGNNNGRGRGNRDGGRGNNNREGYNRRDGRGGDGRENNRERDGGRGGRDNNDRGSDRGRGNSGRGYNNDRCSDRGGYNRDNGSRGGGYNRDNGSRGGGYNRDSGGRGNNRDRDRDSGRGYNRDNSRDNGGRGNNRDSRDSRDNGRGGYNRRDGNGGRDNRDRGNGSRDNRSDSKFGKNIKTTKTTKNNNGWNTVK